MVAVGSTPERRLWTRDFVFSIVTNFFIAMIFYLLMTTMAVYAVDRFQASETGAGLAASGFILGAVVGRVFAGKLLDVLGRRRILMVSLAVFVAMSLLYIPAQSLGLFITVRVLHGIAFGAGTTALAASVMSLIPPLRRGEGTAFFGTSNTLATAIGPFLSLQLVDGPGYPTLFALCAVVSALAMAFGLLIRFPVPTLSQEQRAAVRRLHPKEFVEVSALPIASMMLLVGLAYSGVLTFINSYAQELDLVDAASAFFIVFAVVTLICRPFAGRLQDVRGDNIVVIPALCAFAAGLATLAYAQTPAMMWTAGGLVGLGFGTLMSSSQAIAVTAAPVHRVGLATSTFYLATDLGVGVGPILLGLLLGGTDYGTMYALLAALVLGAVGLYYAVHGRAHARRRGALQQASEDDSPEGPEPQPPGHP
ncbi:MFS transporter [Occultella glacieicola]|uniref:MFS transporter n=1 Tax=Occultella glacieicola TaxID=2518684 RepID=A0ABY2E2C4_9MICO|nr:MFS transporter [Occultella glacieicola]TDE92721.1 MFS transporter [Occultella glacieicola]